MEPLSPFKEYQDSLVIELTDPADEKAASAFAALREVIGRVDPVSLIGCEISDQKIAIPHGPRFVSSLIENFFCSAFNGRPFRFDVICARSLALVSYAVEGVEIALAPSDLSGWQHKLVEQAKREMGVFAPLPNGLCLGESHESKLPKRYLIERMGTLRASGYTTLYLEHIPASFQSLLDRWDPAAEVPLLLRRWVEELDGYIECRHSPWSYMKLIESAKRAGMRIVAFEIETSYDTDRRWAVGNSLVRRLPIMNYLLRVRMEEEPPEGKYVALVGYLHMADYQEVPGLQRMLQAPSFCLFDRLPSDAKRETAITSSRQFDAIDEAASIGQ